MNYTDSLEGTGVVSTYSEMFYFTASDECNGGNTGGDDGGGPDEGPPDTGNGGDSGNSSKTGKDSPGPFAGIGAAEMKSPLSSLHSIYAQILLFSLVFLSYYL
jgi:hypothetical protein